MEFSEVIDGIKVDDREQNQENNTLFAGDLKQNGWEW